MKGIKTMRAELGMTQSELAAALHVSFTAVNRWENDRTRPTRTAYSVLMEYAKKHGVSRSCMEEIRTSFEMTRTRQNSPQLKVEGMTNIDRELLYQLVEEAEPAIYVTDAATDELLYVNRAVEEATGYKRSEMGGKKCYSVIANRSTPCTYCHKNLLQKDRFLVSSVESPLDGQLYTARAKAINWNGRPAHVRYMTAISNNQILQNIPCGICVYNVGADGTLSICYANDGYYDLCEGTKQEADAAFARDKMFNICEDQRKRVKTFVIDLLEQHREGEITYHYLAMNGLTKWVNATINYVDGKGSVSDKLYCIFHDVTRSVSNEMQLRSILNDLPVAMIVFKVKDNLLQLQYISENCVNITGFTAQETYARNDDGRAADANPEAQQYFLMHLSDDIKTKKNLTYTYSVQCKDGVYRYVNLSLTHSEVDGEALYHGSLRAVDYHGKEQIMTDVVSAMAQE